MFSVKSYKTGRNATEHEFYVLCKGNNSGRPSYTVNANCFVVIAGCREEMEQLYWLSYAIWKGRGFEMYLKGSVIPFLTIHDYVSVLRERLGAVSVETTGKVVKALTILDESEAAACKQLDAILQMRRLLLGRLLV